MIFKDFLMIFLPFFFCHPGHNFRWEIRETCMKEALHIHLTPEDQRFNRDVGLELPGCWVSTLMTLCVKPRLPPSV